MGFCIKPEDCNKKLSEIENISIKSIRERIYQEAIDQMQTGQFAQCTMTDQQIEQARRKCPHKAWLLRKQQCE